MSQENSIITSDSSEFEDPDSYFRDNTDYNIELNALSPINNDQNAQDPEVSIALEDIRSRLEESTASARALRARARETKRNIEALLKLDAPSTSGSKPKKTPAKSKLRKRSKSHL